MTDDSRSMTCAWHGSPHDWRGCARVPQAGESGSREAKGRCQVSESITSMPADTHLAPEFTPALVSFFVPGVPATKGSAKAIGFIRKHGPKAGRVGVRVINDCDSADAWDARVAYAARLAMKDAPPATGAFWVVFVYVLARPSGHAGKKGLRPSAPAWPAVKPDFDKLARHSADSLTGIVWDDDSRVCVWSGSKRYANEGDQPGFHCTAGRLP